MRRAILFLFSLCAAAEDGQIEKLSGGHQFVSGLAWSREGYLLVSDLPGARILRIDAKGTSLFRDGISAAGVAADEEGRVYICDSKQRQIVRIDRKGKTDVLADKWEGKRLNGPRRITATKSGHVFFTDPAFADADEGRELPFYGIFHINPKGEMDVIARLSSRPNGIALSPDAKTLYVTVADERSLLAWAVDKNGIATQQRVVLRGIEGVPDGIDVAADGRLYVAARELSVYTPDGKRISQHNLQGKPVDVKLGESDLRTLFVAAEGAVYRMRLKEEGGRN